MKSITNFWLRLPIAGKTRIVLFITFAAVFVSAFANGWVVFSSLQSLNGMVGETSSCSGALEAMRGETASFDRYIREKGREAGDAYSAACAETQKRIADLPDDYRKIGPERFSRLWRIRNTYETYVQSRNRLIDVYESGDEDISLLYRVYNIQYWLSEYLQDLTQTTVMEYSDLYQQREAALRRIPYLLFILSGVSLVLTYLSTSLLNNALIRPVRKISEAVHRISDNDFGGGDISVENRDELGELVADFNTMKDTLQVHLETLEENQRLSEQLHLEAVQRMEAEQQLDTARLRLLRSQMDPHFLFNTLNVISGMAELEEASITDRMIRSLSSIFRYNLQTTADLVPLSREMNAVRDYMYLQQMRFGERIRYTEKTDPEIDPESLHIPPLLIQPLVENAIIHGLYDREENGRVTLSVSMESPDLLRICVSDNGTGMEEAALEKLRAAVRESGKKKRSGVPEGERRVGIGLGNLAVRLKRLGPSAGMTIESRPGEGTKVTLLVPQN